MRGGLNIDEVRTKLMNIQEQAKDALDALQETAPVLPEPEQAQVLPEPTQTPVSVDKSWMKDTSYKFKDGAMGRVTLSFPRIMTFIDSNIKKLKEGKLKTDKDWSTIKSRLENATDRVDAQKIIDEYKISFSSNQVAGTRKRKRGNKRRTYRK